MRLDFRGLLLPTAAEAFLLKLTKSGLEGDGAAARASLVMIEQARERRGPEAPLTITRTIVDPGSVTYALLPLRMAKKLDPYRGLLG
jgi:hypothetical protein